MDGQLIFALHAHLPYLSCEGQSSTPAERVRLAWIFEALTETYLPLIDVLERQEGTETPCLTLCLSPTLLYMLENPRVQELYMEYLNQRIEFAKQEEVRLGSDKAFSALPFFYEQRFIAIRELWKRVSSLPGGVCQVFRKLASNGIVELMATTATHIYLPAYQMYDEVAKLQISAGLEDFHRHFDCSSAGFWLPECGYYDGLDYVLAEKGVKYFISSSRAVIQADPPADSGVFQPVQTPAGLLAFPLYRGMAALLGGTDESYSGRSVYRDFDRDVGEALSIERLDPLLVEGARVPTGFKYHRQRGAAQEESGDVSLVYDPEKAEKAAKEDSALFSNAVHALLCEVEQTGEKSPILTCAFDAELFGHYWFEGTTFLSSFFNQSRTASYELVTPSSAASLVQSGEKEVQQGVCLVESSWSAKETSRIWVDGSNSWVYGYTYAIILQWLTIERQFQEQSYVIDHYKAQLTREMLLSQSSDWLYMLNYGVSTRFAENMIKKYAEGFNNLYEQLVLRKLKIPYLQDLETPFPLFPFLSKVSYDKSNDL